MKKSLGIILATVALSILCVVPVLATENNVNAETNLLKQKSQTFLNAMLTLTSFDNNADEVAKKAMGDIARIGKSDMIKGVEEEEANYLKYLQAVLGNAIEAERVAKQNVGAFTDLVKVNPGFQPQLDAAVAAYNNAVAEHQAALVAIDATKAYFDELDKVLDGNGKALQMADPDAPKF